MLSPTSASAQPKGGLSQSILGGKTKNSNGSLPLLVGSEEQASQTAQREPRRAGDTHRGTGSSCNQMAQGRQLVEELCWEGLLQRPPGA